MNRHRCRRVSALNALAALVALSGLLGSGTASATGLSSATSDLTAARQGGSSTPPSTSGESWGPMDVSLANVNFGELPIAVEAGQAFEVRVQAPGGADCAGRIAYPNGQWQSLDEAGTRVGPCGWDVTVPVGTRPGTLTLAADIDRAGQSRTIVGVVYVSTWTLGQAGGVRRTDL